MPGTAAPGSLSTAVPGTLRPTPGPDADDRPSGDDAAVGAGAPEGDHAGQPGGGPGSLAERQAALVEALTSQGSVPPGFDAFRFEAARVALLRKRAGEVSRQWPMLAAGFGDRWKREFAEWAAARPTQGSLRDGWDFARELVRQRALPAIAAAELAEREATVRYDGLSAPKPRRGPAVGVAAGAVVVRAGRKVWVVRRS
ncbi:hypothetical protein AB0J83_27230 [Actinoplanes sp. NPDC049596]|uniref:hypothetical protein n=1 Tax=unclassified Actinoplanes TaxID=2626549 RepID=UPI0034268E27